MAGESVFAPTPMRSACQFVRPSMAMAQLLSPVFTEAVAQLVGAIGAWIRGEGILISVAPS